jgi:hypothetical protein
MATILERRRERIRNLIAISIELGYTPKIWQGYALLTEVNKRLNEAYLLNKQN